MNLSKVRGLALNGGGVLGIGHVGVLSELNKHGLLKQFDHFCGASVGSIIVAALACNAEYDYIYEKINTLDFKNFLDDTQNDLNIVDAIRLLRENGWYKGEALSAFYKSIMKDLTGNEDITFSDVMTRYGNYVMMPAYRANDEQTVFLDFRTFPNLPMWLGMRWSSSYPFLFVADTVSADDMRYYTNGQIDCDVITMFADGGILDNYPIGWLESILPAEQVIGSRLSSPDEIVPITKIPPPPPANILQYGLGMGSAIRRQALKIHVDDDSWRRTIKINVKDLKSTDFSIDEKNKKWLFDSGCQGFNTFLKTLNLLNDNA